MTLFRLEVSCEASGCDEKAWLDHEDLTPVCSENLKHVSPGQERLAMFVLDTGWLDLPDGWTFGEMGALCPRHRAVGAADAAT